MSSRAVRPQAARRLEQNSVDIERLLMGLDWDVLREARLKCESKAKQVAHARHARAIPADMHLWPRWLIAFVSRPQSADQPRRGSGGSGGGHHAPRARSRSVRRPHAPQRRGEQPQKRAEPSRPKQGASGEESKKAGASRHMGHGMPASLLVAQAWLPWKEYIKQRQMEAPPAAPWGKKKK